MAGAPAPADAASTPAASRPASAGEASSAGGGGGGGGGKWALAAPLMVVSVVVIVARFQQQMDGVQLALTYSRFLQWESLLPFDYIVLLFLFAFYGDGYRKYFMGFCCCCFFFTNFFLFWFGLAFFLCGCFHVPANGRFQIDMEMGRVDVFMDRRVA